MHSKTEWFNTCLRKNIISTQQSERTKVELWDNQLERRLTKTNWAQDGNVWFKNDQQTNRSKQICKATFWLINNVINSLNGSQNQMIKTNYYCLLQLRNWTANSYFYGFDPYSLSPQRNKCSEPQHKEFCMDKH